MKIQQDRLAATLAASSIKVVGTLDKPAASDKPKKVVYGKKKPAVKRQESEESVVIVQADTPDVSDDWDTVKDAWDADDDQPSKDDWDAEDQVDKISELDSKLAVEIKEPVKEPVKNASTALKEQASKPALKVKSESEDSEESSSEGSSEESETELTSNERQIQQRKQEAKGRREVYPTNQEPPSRGTRS